ncbi:MAG: hypothetical protein JOZ90_03655 [Alphaproteobacteria bacterium]|nr:hypothetical protein [Alphaproteobacteria bacterium]MBV9372675.1 hypothetical protein [Alphaproteobacteria bacterium]MBV9900175.1 hypothetical protein [Alphaproteobacteria bacterium]
MKRFALAAAAAASALLQPCTPASARPGVPLLPAAYRGSWDVSHAACGRAGETRLTVTAAELRFHESLGRIVRVVREGPRRVALLVLYEGEGERWRARQRLRLSPDGARLTISGGGPATTRLRCRPEGVR